MATLTRPQHAAVTCCAPRPSMPRPDRVSALIVSVRAVFWLTMSTSISVCLRDQRLPFVDLAGDVLAMECVGLGVSLVPIGLPRLRQAGSAAVPAAGAQPSGEIVAGSHHAASRAVTSGAVRPRRRSAQCGEILPGLLQKSLLSPAEESVATRGRRQFGEAHAASGPDPWTGEVG